MKVFLFLVMISMSFSAIACEGSEMVKIKLHQSRFSLDLFQHAKDAMNAVELELPIGCDLYNQLEVGDNILKEEFRTGSFIISGSIGKWNLTVIEK